MKKEQSDSNNAENNYQQVIQHLEEAMALVEKKYAEEGKQDPTLTKLFIHLRVIYQLMGENRDILLKIGDKMGLEDSNSEVQDAEFVICEEETLIEEENRHEEEA